MHPEWIAIVVAAVILVIVYEVGEWQMMKMKIRSAESDAEALEAMAKAFVAAKREAQR